jgi:hypothetical protein
VYKYEPNLQPDYYLKDIELQYLYQFFLDQSKWLVYLPYLIDLTSNNNPKLFAIDSMECT